MLEWVVIGLGSAIEWVIIEYTIGVGRPVKQVLLVHSPDLTFLGHPRITGFRSPLLSRCCTISRTFSLIARSWSLAQLNYVLLLILKFSFCEYDQTF